MSCVAAGLARGPGQIWESNGVLLGFPAGPGLGVVVARAAGGWGR